MTDKRMTHLVQVGTINAVDLPVQGKPAYLPQESVVMKHQVA